MKIKNLTKEQLINTFVKGDKETLNAYFEVLNYAGLVDRPSAPDWIFLRATTSNFVGCRGFGKFYSTNDFNYIKKIADDDKVIVKELTLSDLTYKNKTKEVFTPCGFKMPWEAVKAFDEGIELFVNEDDKFVMIVNPSDLFRFDPQEMHTKEVKEIEWYEDIPEGGGFVLG